MKINYQSYKNTYIKHLKKYLFIIMILGSPSYLFAGFIIDTDQKVCQASCYGDKECEFAADLCNASVSYLGNTLDSTAIKLFTQTLGKAMEMTAQQLLNRGIYSSLAEAQLSLLNLFAQSLRQNGAIDFQNIVGMDKAFIIEFAIDLVAGITSNILIDNLSHESLSSIRNIPGIHDSAPDSAIRDGLKILFSIFYNDVKASIFFVNGFYAKAAGAGVVDNGLVLVDISVKVSNALGEALDDGTAATMSIKRGEILDIRAKYEKAYHVTDPDTYDNHLEKHTLLYWYDRDCAEIKLSLSEHSLANWSNPSFGSSHGSKLTKSLKDTCNRYKEEMIKREENKYELATIAKLSFSRERYINLVEYYFKSRKYDYYMELYDVENYDPKVGVSSRSYLYKSLKTLNAHGLRPKRIMSEHGTNYFPSKLHITKILAEAIKVKYGVKISIIQMLQDNGISTDIGSGILRKDLAKLLVIYFQLDDKLTAWQKKKISIIHSDDSPRIDISKLASFRVIPFNPNNYREEDLSSNFTVMKWLSSALDISTCNHINCSYKDILGGNL